jgi:pimeloyl-[acyl-carrier protein] synthase
MGSIFVAGGTGFIGRKVVELGAASGRELAVLTRNLPPSETPLAANVSRVPGDLLQPGAWQQAAADADLAIYAAAPPAWGRRLSKDVALEYQEGMAAMTDAFFKSLDPARVKRIVYVAGASYYGDTGATAAVESQQPQPKGTGPYIEPAIDLVRCYAERGYPVVLTFPGAVYGPESWLAQLILEPLHRRKTIPSVRGRDPAISVIHIEDCARALLHLAEHAEPGESYFIADDMPVTLPDIVSIVSRLTGLDPKMRAYPAWLSKIVIGPILTDAATANCVISNEKLKATGFRLSYPTMEEGLPPVIDEWRAKHDGKPAPATPLEKLYGRAPRLPSTNGVPMKLADLAALPLRAHAVRAPLVRALVTKERLQSGVALNPLDREVRKNPYPALRRIQEHDPVHWSELARGWLITRYEDVSSLLRDPRISADRTPTTVDAAWRRESEVQAWLEHSLLGLDPPDHTRLRNLVNRAFTPRVVERMRDHIEAIADELLDAAEARGSFDAIGDFAQPLPVRVITELLGAPPEDHHRFAEWSASMAVAFDIAFHKSTIERADRAIVEMRDYFRPLLDERRREPKDDLLTALVEAEEQGDRLSEEELYSFCIILLAAGHETATNMIGNGLLALLKNRDQLEKLVADPSLGESAVEEVLRYDPPPQATTRRALEAIELGGKHIREGDMLVLSIAAANRDPERFVDPDRLDITRTDNRHLTFGLGAHYCIGAPLARMEGQVAFTRLLERFPNLRGQPGNPPKRRNTATVRALASLPLTW